MTDTNTTNENPMLMSSYYSKLAKKFKENKPNLKMVQQLLDPEFTSRKAFVLSLSNLPGSQRVGKILEAYPCFQKGVHVS